MIRTAGHRAPGLDVNALPGRIVQGFARFGKFPRVPGAVASQSRGMPTPVKGLPPFDLFPRVLYNFVARDGAIGVPDHLEGVLMPASCKVLACATVVEEMLPLLPDGVEYQVFDFGLHVNPANLKRALQDAIDAAGETADVVFLGYGLCSMAVVGLRANGCTLVVPRVDDCIAIFLGSSCAYKEQATAEPGTYYVTKGWLKVGDTPFDEYESLAARYGPAKAEWVIREMIKHYTRLALIATGGAVDEIAPGQGDPGQGNVEDYREQVRVMAERWGLRFEEIPGSDALVRKMLFGPWDDEFVVVPPGESIRYEHFFPPEPDRVAHAKEEGRA